MERSGKSPTSPPSRNTPRPSTSSAGVLEVTIPPNLPSHRASSNTPSGELLATAGDDGNVLLWTPSDNPAYASSFGDDGQEDVEHWRVKTMCRSSSGSEIYDLAWSPDGMFFITGSMDNVARIYNATTGKRRSRAGSLDCV